MSQGAPLTTSRLLTQLGEPQVTQETDSVALGSPATFLTIPDGLDSRNMVCWSLKQHFNNVIFANANLTS